MKNWLKSFLLNIWISIKLMLIWSITHTVDIPHAAMRSIRKTFGVLWRKSSRIIIWVMHKLRSGSKQVAGFTATCFRRFSTWYKRSMWHTHKEKLIGIVVAVTIAFASVYVTKYLSSDSWFSWSNLLIGLIVLVAIAAVVIAIKMFAKRKSSTDEDTSENLKTFGKGLLVAGLFHLAVAGLIWVLVPDEERLRNILAYLFGVPFFFLTTFIIIGVYTFGERGDGYKWIQRFITGSTAFIFLFGVAPYFFPDHIKESAGNLFAQKNPAGNAVSNENVARGINVSYLSHPGNSFEKYAGSPGEFLPTEYADLIDVTFNDLGGDVVKVMKSIAWCESRGKQFVDSARTIPLRGDMNSHDIGLFQINDTIHPQMIQQSRENIETAEGNIRFARKLYDVRKVNDWSASKDCWDMGYKNHPPGWPKERTPEQVAAYVAKQDEIIVVDLPKDSSMSEQVLTFDRAMNWVPEKNIRYIAYNEKGDSVMSHHLEKGEWVQDKEARFTDNLGKFIRFRSFSPDFVRMTVTRINH